MDGYSIVISGTFENYSREELKKIIEDNGGKYLSAPSKKTSFILAGEGMGSVKIEAARKLNIKLVSIAEFFEMIKE